MHMNFKTIYQHVNHLILIYINGIKIILVTDNSTGISPFNN